MVYAIDSESSPTNHVGWREGVRIGPVDEDVIMGFIQPFYRPDRVGQGTAGEGFAVDADGNVYAAEGPNSLSWTGGAFTEYENRYAKSQKSQLHKRAFHRSNWKSVPGSAGSSACERPGVIASRFPSAFRLA